MHASNLLLLFAAATYAQSTASTAPPDSPTTSGDIPDCVLQCINTAAASAGCSSGIDLICVCTSVHDAAMRCVQGTCPESIGDGQAAQQLLCSGEGPITTSTTFVIPTSGSSTASSPASSSTSSANKELSMGIGSVWAVTVGLIGGVGGALLL